mmetsp:Transcript_63787/g.113504  ORF Transcript_63787/g.113504 Transcript_63787/m.113504 type:complete len:268 (-) Transcript_63787:7-810(-)
MVPWLPENSFNVSRYCVMIIMCIACSSDMPVSVMNFMESPKPCAMAARMFATPTPESRFASASASPDLIFKILSASPRSIAASRCRRAALISFMDLSTFGSAMMSVMSTFTTSKPWGAIASLTAVLMSLTILSFASKLSSKVIVGIVERKTLSTSAFIMGTGSLTWNTAVCTISFMILNWTAVWTDTVTLSFVLQSDWQLIWSKASETGITVMMGGKMQAHPASCRPVNLPHVWMAPTFPVSIVEKQQQPPDMVDARRLSTVNLSRS